MLTVVRTEIKKTGNMKRIFLLLTAVACAFTLQAQDTTKVKVLNKNVVSVIENNAGTQVKVGNNNGVEVITDSRGDTTKIRIGNRNFDVIDSRDGTKINMTREHQEKNKKYSRFNGHWGGLEMGMNLFRQTDYSLYEGDEFFDLNYGKSLTVNLNVAEYAFKNDRNTVGLVTGLGFNLMDFRFDRPITIAKNNTTGLIEPVDLDPTGLKKSKLNVSYLTVPMFLEVATPLKLNSNRLTLAAGVIGGLNIGSHTKIKHNSSKDKERGNFNINPFKYELTGRIGLGEFCIFANYAMTPLFRDGKGPELYPLTIGISFPNIDF